MVITAVFFLRQDRSPPRPGSFPGRRPATRQRNKGHSRPIIGLAAQRSYAGMEREIVAIGALTRIELWAKDKLGKLKPSDDDAAALSTELGLY